MNQNIYRMQPQSALPNVIFALLIANGLVFALQMLQFRPMMINFALWPPTVPGSPFAPWQLVTYGFLHSNLGHIFFNMIGLWMFGREIEHLMGSRRFLIYYLACVVGAGILQIIVGILTGELYPMVGASGGVFGILLAYGLAFPNRTVLLLIPPIPMKAKYLVIIFGGLSLFMGISGAAPGIAHFAHLGGMLFGFGMLYYWKIVGRR